MESYFGHWATMPVSILHVMDWKHSYLPPSRRLIGQRKLNLCEGVVEKAEELALFVLCLVKATAPWSCNHLIGQSGWNNLARDIMLAMLVVNILWELNSIFM